MVRLLTLSGLFLLLAAPTASAGVREKILRECQDGRITGDYSPAQLRDARKNIPTDIDEYSDCRDVLARAALAGRSSGGGGNGGAGGGGGETAAPGGVLPGGGGGSQVLTPDATEQSELDKARGSAASSFVDGERIVPGATGLAADAARNGLPTSLLIVLVLLGVCGIVAAGPALHRRVRSRRQS